MVRVFFFPRVLFAAVLGSAVVTGWPRPTFVSIAPVFPVALVSAVLVPVGFVVAAFIAAAFISVLVSAFCAHGSGFLDWARLLGGLPAYDVCAGYLHRYDAVIE